MFNIPAIHHLPRFEDDGTLGSMHLNALNGSTNVLGYSDAPSPFSGVFGGVFGVSLSENHPYRPLDSGSTFHDSRSNSLGGSPSSSSSSKCNASSHKHGHGHGHSHQRSSSSGKNESPKSSRKEGGKSLGKPGALESMLVRSYNSPIGIRRRSLDLDAVSTGSGKCHLDEMSLSLEELTPRPTSRYGSRVGGVINEHEVCCDLDLTSLSINDVDISTGDPSLQPAENATSANAHCKKRRRRAHTTDSATSERAIRLLDRIKDSRKDANGFKHSLLREDSNRSETETVSITSEHSSTSSNRPILRHHSHDSIQAKLDSHRHRKFVTRASVE